MNRRPISAAILAGGQSRRMGRDKALISLVEGGPPMAAMVAAVVSTVAEEVFFVSRPRDDLAELGWPVRPDLYGDVGVLGGLASAIAHAKHDACFVVGCDMPFLNAALLDWMAGRAGESDALIPVVRGSSRQGGGHIAQTLHAIYRRSCLPAIEGALASGERRATSFLSDVRVEIVTQAQIRRFDPDLLSFMSVDTPESLASARARLTAAAE